MIDHAYEQQRVFRAVVGRHSGRQVERMFRAVLVDLVRSDLAAFAPRAPMLEATVQFVAGGFMSLLAWWLETPTSLGPAEADALFQRWVRPTVAALRTE